MEGPVSDILPAGARLSGGRYEVQGLLGRGGFGITYDAWDHRLNRRVAIKEFFPVGCLRAEARITPGTEWTAEEWDRARQRFRREGQALARLDDPGIVPIYDVLEENDTVYLVMKFVEGQTLEEYVAARPGARLGWQEAVELVRQAGQAMAKVHEAGLLHRDLKPSNLMRQPDGQVVLLDFGAVAEFCTRQGRSLTRIGTPHFAAPEQYGSGLEQGPPTDVYGLAATLYCLLTGEAPVQAPVRAAGVRLPPPRELHSEVPAAVSEAVMAGLELDPGRRPASMRAFLDRLSSAQPLLAETLPATPPRPSAPRRPTQVAPRPVSPPPRVVSPPRRPARALVVPVLVVLALLTVVWWGRQRKAGVGRLLERVAQSDTSASSTVAWPANPQPGDEWVNPQDGAEMVWVPEGEFLMGSDPEEINAIWKRLGWPEGWKRWAADESPKHRVGVDGFWMYKYEVTVAQYRKFCEATGRRMPSQPGWSKDNHPVVNVSWNDATAYCAWAGVRLPTEAEWEYAARGGNTGLNGKPRYVFVWGDDLPKGRAQVGNLADETAKKKNPGWVIFAGYEDGYVETAPVGSFRANGFGLHDMAGNVWEWCQDGYKEDFYATCARRGVVRNPLCNEVATVRVLRGGSWFYDPGNARAADRNWYNPDSSRSSTTGSGVPAPVFHKLECFMN